MSTCTPLTFDSSHLGAGYHVEHGMNNIELDGQELVEGFLGCVERSQTRELNFYRQVCLNTW